MNNHSSSDLLISTIVSNNDRIAEDNYGEGLPSFFESYAIDSLDSTIQDVINQFSNALINLMPVRYINVNEYLFSDWNYYIITLISLLYRDNSLAESIFNYSRVHSNNSTKYLKYIRILIMAFLPKLLKLLISFIANTTVNTYDQLNNSIITKLIRVTKRILYNLLNILKISCPFIVTAVNILNIVQQLLFLFKLTIHHNLSSKLLRYKLIKSNSNSSNQSNTSLISFISVILLIRLYRSYVTMINQNPDEEGYDVLTRDNAQTIQYPDSFNVIPGGIIPPKDKKLCPICRNIRSNSCASTGGYLFCYKCLIEHVNNHNSCPITGLYCSNDDIVRIFED